jgi:hypothetical protein
MGAAALDMVSIEQALLQQPQVDCPITHHFGGGVYLREMFAPAGTIILGHEHTGEHMCILLKGSMRILNENGTTSDITAPMTFVGRPGRKLALTLEDVVFMNVLPNTDNETDVDKLEARYVRKSSTWTEHQLEAGIKSLNEVSL